MPRECIALIKQKLVFCLLALSCSSAFSETYRVNDTTLNDHGNPSINGTIAFALETCEQNGGGIVSIAEGNYFTQHTLKLGKNCRLIGDGMDVTTISKSSSMFGDLIRVNSGRNSVSANWAVENLTLSLPITSSSNFLSTVPLRSNNGLIRNIKTVGGSVDSWGLNIDSALVLDIDGFIHRGEGSGILWHNSGGIPYNIGDAAVRNTTIVIKNPGATGIKFASPIFVQRSSNPYRVNNILLSRVEVQTPDGIVRTGTTGIHLINTARITLAHVDIEHMDIGLLQESGIDGGAVATNNTFLQVFTIGCNSDYVEVGTEPQQQLTIGGTGALGDLQRFPSSNIEANHPILGFNRVLTAVRPIEAYTNIFQARQLSVKDSGTIFTNKGSTDTVTFILPPANLSFSVEYEFHLATNQRIRVQPAAGDIIRPSQIQVGKYYESDIGWGQALKIRNIDGTIWSVLHESGNWQSEN